MTTHTIHFADDHSVMASAELDDLDQEVHDMAAKDREAAEGAARRYYIHDGAGVTGAFLTQGGAAQQIAANGYKSSDANARAARAAYGIKM